MDDLKNIYSIKHALSELKPIIHSKSVYKHELIVNSYRYYCGDFILYIETRSHTTNDRITKHEFLKVDLYESASPPKLEKYIQIMSDPRFCNYEPIQYEDARLIYGNQMPILILCELIKYLHRLSNISIFT